MICIASKAGADVRYVTDKDGDTRLDEVCVKDPKFVHLEQMDDGHWWLRIDRYEGDAVVVNLATKRNARIDALAEWD